MVYYIVNTMESSDRHGYNFSYLTHQFTPLDILFLLVHVDDKEGMVIMVLGDNDYVGSF